MTTPDTNPCYMCGHTAVVKTFREFETEKLSGTYYYCANCYTKIITSYFNKGRKELCFKSTIPR